MTQDSSQSKSLSRRQFLKAMGAATAGLLAAGCQRQPSEPPTPTEIQAATLTPRPTRDPTIEALLNATPTSFSEVIAATSTASPLWNPTAQVAIGRAATYDHFLVKEQLQTMLESLGSISDVVGTGDRVAIKVNLTGGVSAHQFDIPAIESVVTHPEIVSALGELLIDAGAGEIFIIEAVYEWASFTAWGYEDVARALNATLVDLNQPEPYSDFAVSKVGPGWSIYEEFTFNRILEEVHSFISIAKMKCHTECGVTHTMKNLVGLAPVSHYQLAEGDGYRTAFHGQPGETKTRLPRVVVDLNLARPINLAIIDGIKTIQGGEGSWSPGAAPISPGLLLAGKTALATDAVATAIQGFDPVADYPNAPFKRAQNHLNLAYQSGLGTNRLEEIHTFGAMIEDVKFPFKPAGG